MSDETYNGWKGKGNRASAYATWRVNLELVGDMVNAEMHKDAFDEKPDEYDLADWLKDSVEELVCMKDPHGEHLTTQYALAFLDDVNYDEIAEHILLDWDDD